MNNGSDYDEFRSHIAGACEIYGKRLTDTLLKTYWNATKHLTVEQFTHAMSAHALDPEQGMFFPLPAHLMRHISGTQKENAQHTKDRAKLAWQEVIEHLKKKGAYVSLKSEDKILIHALNAVGGLNALSTQTYDDLNWTEKRFVEHYEASEHKDQGLLPDRAPGLIEHHNEDLEGRKNMANLIGEAVNRIESEN